MSVSRRAAAGGARDGDPVLRRRQRRAPARLVVLDLGQQHRQVGLGHGHGAAVRAVDDRDRRAPVALARDQPVAQAVVDRLVALALLPQPAHDRPERLAVGAPVKLGTAVDERSVAAVGKLLAAFDHTADGKLVGLREGEVALVVRRNGHDRAGAVLHQHVVGDVHRQRLAVDGVGDGAPERHARLRLAGVAAQLLVGGQRAVDVVGDCVLLTRPLRQAQDVGVLGRHDEERRTEQRVRPRREHRVVDLQLVAGEDDLRALRAPDPVALHRLDVLGPADRAEILEQPVGVVGDAKEPLRQLAHLDERARALTAAVLDLLVGEHGLLDGIPVDGGLLLVGQALAEEGQEDPLRPAVDPRLVGAELARPVDRDPPLAKLALKRGDRGVRGVARMLSGGDRVVLGGQAEGVVTHRVQHAAAGATVEVRDRVADRVDLQVADVRLAARIGQHLEHVGRRPRVRAVVGDLPRALVGPHLLPAGLDLGGVVAVLGHQRAEG